MEDIEYSFLYRNYSKHIPWNIALSRAMGERFKESMRILDYFAGTCQYAIFLKHTLHDFSYYGIDVKEYLRYGYDKFPEDKRIKLGYIKPDENYENVDVILLGSIFTHLIFSWDDREKLLGELFEPEVESNIGQSFITICDKFKSAIEQGAIVVFTIWTEDEMRIVSKNNLYHAPECWNKSYYTLNAVEKYCKSRNFDLLECESFLDGSKHNHRIFRIKESK